MERQSSHPADDCTDWGSNSRGPSRLTSTRTTDVTALNFLASPLRKGGGRGIRNVCMPPLSAQILTLPPLPFERRGDPMHRFHRVRGIRFIWSHCDPRWVAKL